VHSSALLYHEFGFWFRPLPAQLCSTLGFWLQHLPLPPPCPAQLYPFRFNRLLDEAHQSLGQLAVPAVIVDGNFSSIRDRCTCLNIDMVEERPDALGLQDRDNVFLFKFCSGHPERRDKFGRCKECVSASRMPPSATQPPPQCPPVTRAAAAAAGEPQPDQLDTVLSHDDKTGRQLGVRPSPGAVLDVSFSGPPPPSHTHTHTPEHLSMPPLFAHAQKIPRTVPSPAMLTPFISVDSAPTSHRRLGCLHLLESALYGAVRARLESRSPTTHPLGHPTPASDSTCKAGLTSLLAWRCPPLPQPRRLQ